MSRYARTGPSWSWTATPTSPLLRGQIPRVLHQRPPGALHFARSLVIAVAAQLVPCLSAHLVQRLHRPGDHMERIKAEHRLRRSLRHRRVDPLGAISGNMRQLGRPRRTQRIEERQQRLGVSARRRPHQPAGVMIDHTGQISVTLPVRDLIDPDPPQPGQQVLLTALISDNPLHDAGDGPPCHPHQLTHHALRRPRREPRAAVLERMREPGSGPCPRHRRYDHPTPPTFHPRRRRLQEHHHRAGIQRPPPTDPTPGVIPPAPPTAPRASRPRRTGRANRDHQHLLVGALLTLEPKAIDRRPFDTKDLPPYPGCAHTVPCLCGPDLDSQKPYRARCVAQTQPETSPTKTAQGPNFGL